jgi:hypothetical protein
MFYGPYYITEVKHDITPGKFTTSFTGIRQQIFALPPLDNYMQTLTKTLFSEVQTKIQQQTSSKNTTTNTTENTTTDNPVQNFNKVLNPQSCLAVMNNVYKQGSNTYIQANQIATTMNATEVVDGIKANIDIKNVSNSGLTRMLAFVTIYWESFNGTYFNCFNNNFCGAKLDYKWPTGLSNYFSKEYLCLQDSNGNSAPNATFKTKEDMYKFLGAKWGKENGYSITDINLTQKLINNYGTPKNYTTDVQQTLIKLTNNAITLARLSGIDN